MVGEECIEGGYVLSLNGARFGVPYYKLFIDKKCSTLNVGPCHHGMARPRVADGGTASNMEGS